LKNNNKIKKIEFFHYKKKRTKKEKAVILKNKIKKNKIIN